MSEVKKLGLENKDGVVVRAMAWPASEAESATLVKRHDTKRLELLASVQGLKNLKVGYDTLAVIERATVASTPVAIEGIGRLVAMSSDAVTLKNEVVSAENDGRRGECRENTAVGRASAFAGAGARKGQSVGRAAADRSDTASGRCRLAQGGRFAARLLARLASAELETKLVEILLEDLRRIPAEQRQAIRTASAKADMSAIVTSAHVLSQSQRESLLEVLQSLLGQSVSCEWREDQDLMAGIRLSLGPWMLGANLQDELKAFSEAAPSVSASHAS